MPLARSRAEQFDLLVLEAVEALEESWADQLAHVELTIEDVPSVPLHPPPGWTVPLGQAVPAGPDRPARIVVYRRPVQARAGERAELTDLVADVVTEQLADLLGLSPEQVDPDYGNGTDDEG